MPTDQKEIIAEIEENIRRFGGRFGEWCVGTAKDTRGPFFLRHQEADLGDRLASREAFSPIAAQAVVAHLVNDRGLELEGDAVLEPGRVVFVYCKTSPGLSAPRGDQAMITLNALIELLDEKGLIDMKEMMERVKRLQAQTELKNRPH